MEIRTHYWIPIAIFLISLCLHLSLISKGPVTIDCLGLVVESQSTIQTHHLHYLYGSGYPLMVLLGSVFISIGKCVGITDSITAVNFISVIFSSIAVLVFYLLLQEIADTLTAILASFILLLNPIFLDVSTYGINHAPALCFLFLGLLSLLRFQNTGNLPYLCLSALYFGLMGATRLQDFIAILPSIGFMFIFGLKENSPQNHKNKFYFFFLFITIISFIIILLHLPYFIFDHSNFFSQAKSNWQLNLTGSFQGLLSRYFIRSLSYLTQAFSMVGIVCFCAGLYYTAVLNKKILIFTILWWIIPLSLFGNIITSSPRYFNILLPAIIIPISIYLARMLKYKNNLSSLVTLICFLIIILTPLLETQKTFTRRHHDALISDFYRWVGKSTEPDATLICSDDELFLSFYSKRHTLIKPFSPAGHLLPKDLINFKKKLDETLKRRKTVYMTEITFVQNDHYQEFRRFMHQNYRLILVGQMPLELWYGTPFDVSYCEWGLIKVELK